MEAALILGGAGVLALGFLHEMFFKDNRPLAYISDALLIIVVFAFVFVFLYSILTG